MRLCSGRWDPLLYRLVAAVGARLDPRTVRLCDVRRPVRRWLAPVIVVSALLVVVGARAAVSAVRGADQVSTPPPADRRSPIPADVVPGSISRQRPFAAPVRPGPERKQSRFFDPYYVFSEGPLRSFSAYPLVDPPGLVVDLIGSVEPEAPASKMVGEDDRVRSVRRRGTPRGLRYIIMVKTPVRRIEVFQEGAVVMIMPLE